MKQSAAAHLTRCASGKSKTGFTLPESSLYLWGLILPLPVAGPASFGAGPLTNGAWSARWIDLLGAGGDHLAALLQYPIDQTVLDGLVVIHETIAIGILLDTLDALAGMLGQDSVESIARLEHLLGVDLHIGGLALEPAER